MNAHRNLMGAVVVLLACAAPARAHHVAWLDFSAFDLDAYPSVDGNSPPTAADVAGVRQLVIANMAKDYATVDITLTTSKPNNGRYTWVRFFGTRRIDGTAGCAGGSCCSFGTCTGIGSWDDVAPSAAEVYCGTYTSSSEFQDSNATTARIANAISHTASHELGHVLGLSHCNAADDSITKGCASINANTDDANVLWHIMASGGSWGMSNAAVASRDRFFSIHASRRVLHGALQQRNHFATLANLDGGAGLADLTYGRFQSPTTTAWFASLSSGSLFGQVTQWQSNAGDAGDVFLTGDVDGDGQADLVYGRITASNRVIWLARLSEGSGFGSLTTWSTDAGDVGDIFRLADVDGDGRDDLVYGRPRSANSVRWYVRLSAGTSFGSIATWAATAGGWGDVFLLGDLDADGRDDLAYGSALSPTQVQWSARLSNGSSFGSASTWRADAGDLGDLFQLADGNGDGRADLIYGRTFSDTQVAWYFRPSTGTSFGSVDLWGADAGDAGDLFRLGDGSGDGRLDLFYGRPQGMNSLTASPDPTFVRWYGRLSTGSSFAGAAITWASDAGDEGDVFP